MTSGNRVPRRQTAVVIATYSVGLAVLKLIILSGWRIGNNLREATNVITAVLFKTECAFLFKIFGFRRGEFSLTVVVLDNHIMVLIAGVKLVST